MAAAKGSPWIKLGLTGASLVLALVVGELWFRNFAPVAYRRPDRGITGDWSQLVHRPSEGPGLLYEPLPGRQTAHGSKTITVNSLGMRDAEPLANPPASLRRILVLGDSVAFGLGVEDDEIWPHLLEEMLNEEAPATGPYEVLNMAVSGYSTLDEYHQLVYRGVQLDPDLVIVGYFFNDPENEPVNNLHAFFHPTEWWQHSHLLRKLAAGKKKRDRKRYGGKDYFRYLHASPKWNSVLRAFDGIADAGRTHGFETAVAIFPSYRRKKSWDAYPYLELHDQVAEAARERELWVLDLLPAFATSGHMPEEVRVDNWHPNPLGHALAARAVRDWILENAPQLFGS